MNLTGNRSLLLISLAVLLASPLATAAPRKLTFAGRVAAQAAIERVYHAHQVDVRRPFEEAVPRQFLERKVRTYLKQSAALERVWNTPVTAEMLRAELERIARDTVFPDRLSEIYMALGHDPFLVQECFARPALVNRLARSFFSSDERIHGTGAREMSSQRLRWDDWWRNASRGLDPASVEAVASDALPLPAPRALPRGSKAAAIPGLATEASGESAPPELCFPDDVWDNGRLGGPPEARLQHSAVWTGTEMIVWGGMDGIIFRDDGGRYDPLTDTWTPISTTGAPAARMEHTAVWTGSEMIVWGGNDDFYTYRNDGGRYDLATDTWLPISTAGAPTSDVHSTAIWTGSEMIVYGEVGKGRYDPATDTWSPLAGGGPSGRNNSTLWTGDEMIAVGFGGFGGRYDPMTQSWTSMTTTGAPTVPLDGHVAVWTGSEMIVWNGTDSARYDPGTDTWTPISAVGQPVPRTFVVGAWTGSEMVVWGGYQYPANIYFDTGARYDPATDTWQPTSTVNASAGRQYLSAVWTGSELIVWGGRELTEWTNNTGGRYDPAADTWRRTNSWIPAPRTDFAGVWTGNEMILWSGADTRLASYDTPHPDGARYDPLLDDWTFISTTGAPVPTRDHTAVWTGSEMIVWGGDDGDALVDSGGRYDPVADEWAPMTSAGAPTPRQEHFAAWTGTEMIVWGGRDDGGELADGGRYDPMQDLWGPMATAGGPGLRQRYSKVWTGTELIVWGGQTLPDPGTNLDTGARYDPSADSWSPTSVTGAPTPRYWPAAVWDGGGMIVWGGRAGSPTVYYNDGGRYDPVAESWTPISTVGAPERGGNPVAWTGDLMIAWNYGARYDPATDQWSTVSTVNIPEIRGGEISAWTGAFLATWGGDRRSVTDTGGRYFAGGYADIDGDGYTCDADCDDLHAGSFPGAPEVCDGRDSDCDGNLPPDEVDGDADGAPQCADCDDADPLRFAGNPEVCDGIDNDCDLVADEDGDGDGLGVCADCNDNDADTFPGAVETNDGLDNQCPGDFGHGAVDEISGTSGFLTPGDDNEICWPAQPGATEYRVLRARQPGFGSDCVQGATSAACLSDPSDPPAGRVLYYLVRAALPWTGSPGAMTDGGERATACDDGELLCGDGLDNDGDGLTDCDDAANCLGQGCTSTAYSFTDTLSDDVSDTSLEEFFARVPASTSDHLYFSVGPPGGELEICAERADFYRDSYLAWAGSFGSAASDGWSKWSRTAGGAWSGPNATAYPNQYGSVCAGAWSWCPEVGLVGVFPGVSPAGPGVCESFDAATCSDGTWTVTVRIGVDRQSACGF